MRVILFPNPNPPYNLCLRVPSPRLVEEHGEAIALASVVNRGQVCGDIPCGNEQSRYRFLSQWLVNNPRQGEGPLMGESEFAPVGPHYIVDMESLPDMGLFDAWIWEGDKVIVDESKAKSLGLY